MKLKKNILLTLIVFLISIKCYSINQEKSLSIIPQPVSIVKNNEKDFVVDKNIIIAISENSEELNFIANQLALRLRDYLSTDVNINQINRKNKHNSILLIKENIPGLGNEGYILDVNRKQITIRGTHNGVFYGLQTLYQMFPLKNDLINKSKFSIPSYTIIDKPRFEWRGGMLDVARYFQPVSVVKRYIDFLALHKINTFHWHLNDDQGWRIEIKKYPKLTEVGAWRKDSQLELSGKQMAFAPHGGYYTQEEIKDVVKYAAERFISVIPEIEMPGHSYAALASYPELSCTGGPFEVSTIWKVHEDIYCAGNEKTYEFLENILSEVIELFPASYIHIGGDEAPKTRWEACPKCQAKIAAEHLDNEHELQTYMVKRMEDFLATKNRKLIGWDEIIEGGLSPNATVLCWRGFDGAITAAKQGHDAIIAHSKYTYLDHYQSEPYLEPLAWAGLVPYGYTTLQKSYSLEPIPSELNESEQKHIIGLQAQLWLEYIRTTDHMDYMLFPRLSALAEVMWTQKEQKNWEFFKWKMETQYRRYNELNINYSMSAYTVYFDIKTDSLSNKALVSLSTDNYNPTIRYTINGDDPTENSDKYSQPFTVILPLTIKAANFNNGQRISKINQKTILKSRIGK
ncbi:MAG: family 20 glycosylhydrolase [Paludibacter sp.]|nr:family 20 glycosylhydrolase [Paludibacter sp.]